MHEISPKSIQDYIQPRYSLLKEINECKAVEVITALAKRVPNFGKTLHDLELVILVCLYIENIKIRSTNKAKKVDKEALVKNIYHNLFNTTPDCEEMSKVLEDIKFLINNKKIKSLVGIKSFFLTLKAYLFKRK